MKSRLYLRRRDNVLTAYNLIYEEDGELKWRLFVNDGGTPLIKKVTIRVENIDIEVYGYYNRKLTWDHSIPNTSQNVSKLKKALRRIDKICHTN